MLIAAKTLQVRWHVLPDRENIPANDNQPVYSIDFQPNGDRLATSGGDNTVRLWLLPSDSSGNVGNPSYLATLNYHGFAVNCVRWDPKGEQLASADDDGVLIIWTKVKNEGSVTLGDEGTDKQFDVETWKVKCRRKIFECEIFSIDWSPDSKYIAAGSMKNVVKIFDVNQGTDVRQMAEHSGIVQGVAWDPRNEYLATQSSDKAVHIYLLNSNGQSVLETQHHRHDLPERIEPPAITNMNPPASASSRGHSRKGSFTKDERARLQASPRRSESPGAYSSSSSTTTSSSVPPPQAVIGTPGGSIPTPAVLQLGSPQITPRGQMGYGNEASSAFFRRLAFSPDGSLLFTPTGLFKSSGGEDSQNTVYIYSRAGLNKPPVAHLPGIKKQALVVRCSPVIFELKSQPVKTHRQFVDSENLDNEPKSLPEAMVSSNSNTSNSGSNNSGGPVFNLPYRMMYAVATKDSVIIYDTQQAQPLCIVTHLSTNEFTDLTWNKEGNTLVASSLDGFCSVVEFKDMGEVYKEPVTSDETKLNTATISSSSSSSMATAANHKENDQTEPVNTQVKMSEPQEMAGTISPVPPVGLHGGSPQKASSTSSATTSTGEKRALSSTPDEGKKKQRRIRPQWLGTSSDSAK